ncbi:YrhK family protein [Actinoplanes sp. DH11]|uniref:YrhK family protein n=1 Tax=Actinoplanes sp. DH11 TaxID=2857011 RepID=UPI001E42A124|nr:hypothetical protein [Actinoplanes sp. DH11]
MRPTRLDAAIAGLFIVGSSCFVAGSVPAYADAVGVTAQSSTYFLGSIFFTAASYLQLVQAQTPPATETLVTWRLLPRDRNWLAAITQFAGTILFNVSTLAALAQNLTVRQQDEHVWRPDVFGSTLFIASSVFGVLALGSGHRLRPRWIAWLNLTGCVLFMAAAVAGFVLPGTGDVLDIRVDLAGTLLGALCFLLGAALMLPAPTGRRRTPRRRTSVPKAPKEST